MKARACIASLAFAAFAVAGCSNSSSAGGGDDNTAATPPVITATPSASASESPSKSPKPTPSFSSTVKASHVCKLAGLAITLGQPQGAAGSTILPIVFANDSKKPCTLFGYPGVSFLDSNHQQIGLPADRRGGEQAVVTLAPGDTASSQLRIPDPGNFSPDDCKAATSAYLLVYPPGETHSNASEESTQVCTTEGGRAVVQPVVPGSGA